MIFKKSHDYCTEATQWQLQLLFFLSDSSRYVNFFVNFIDGKSLGRIAFVAVGSDAKQIQELRHTKSAMQIRKASINDEVSDTAT